MVIDVDYGAVGVVRQPRAGPPATCGTSEAALFDYHYGEGAYDETERAIQELLGVEREPRRARAPRGRARRRARPSDRRPGGRLLRPLRGRRGVWAVLDGAGTVRRQRPRDRGRPAPASTPLVEHERHTEGVLELRSAEGVTCFAVCFTPGALASRPSSACVAVAEQARELGRAVVARRSRTLPGQYGLRVGLGAEEKRLVDPEPVLTMRAPAGAATRPGRRRASGPARWVWPKTTCSASHVEPAQRPRPSPRRPARRSAGPESSARSGPRPARVERRDRRREATPPTRRRASRATAVAEVERPATRAARRRCAVRRAGSGEVLRRARSSSA